MKIFLLVLTLALLMLSCAVQAQWVDVSPVSGGNYYATAVSGSNLFAAPKGRGVYLSTDNGTTWTQVNSGLTDTSVSAFLVSGTNIFAGVSSGKVFLSTNNGTNWTQTGVLGSNTSELKSFAVSGTNLFAGTLGSGVYLSTDNGTSWTQTSLRTDHEIYALAFSGTNLFAALNGSGGVYLSTDNGTSWAAVNSGLADSSATSLAVSGSSLFVGVRGHIYVSTNNGTSWTDASAGLTGWGVYPQSLASFGTNVFVGTFLGGVYLSTNNGTLWVPINEGFIGNPLVGAFAISATYVYVGVVALGAPYNSPGGLWRRPLTDVIVFPPPIPSLVSPVNLASDQPTSLTLKWNTATRASGYQCQISLDPTFKINIVVNDSTLTDTTDSITGLGNSTTYYWRVRAYNSGGLSAFSTVNSFTTIMQAPGMPALVSPANNATNQPWNAKLVCTKATGAAQYHWQVSTAITFSSFAADDTTSDTTKTVSLQSGTKYYWRVQAVNPTGPSAFAGPDSFTVMVAPATSPLLLSPANGATYQRADTLALIWHPALGASGYEVQVSDILSFARFVVNDSTADTVHQVTSLKNLQKYYWRVRGYNAGGAGSFSVADSFTTIISVPTIPKPMLPTFRASDIPLKATFKWSTSALATRYKFQIATASNVYSSGDSLGAFLPENVVFDTTLADTSLQLSTSLTASSRYFWHVSAIDTAGSSGYSNNPLFSFTTTVFDAVSESIGIPKEFTLLQNYPNPFNPSTIIKYNLPKPQMVSLRVYNFLGQEVATIVNTLQNAGYYEVNFNANHLSSGVYFYKLKTENFNSVHKMLLIK